MLIIARYVLGWRMDCEATAQASLFLIVMIIDHSDQFGFFIVIIINLTIIITPTSISVVLNMVNSIVTIMIIVMIIFMIVIMTITTTTMVTIMIIIMNRFGATVLTLRSPTDLK